MARSRRTPADTNGAQDERWAEWDRFVSAHPHGGFMQSSSWIRCRARDGYEHLAIMLRGEDRCLAGGAVVGRWTYGDNQAFYYIQEGPLLPHDPELAEAVMSATCASSRAAAAGRRSHRRGSRRPRAMTAFASRAARVAWTCAHRRRSDWGR
jgi:FemAB family